MKKLLIGGFLSCSLIFSHTTKQGKDIYYSPCDNSYYVKNKDSMKKVIK